MRGCATYPICLFLDDGQSVSLMESLGPGSIYSIQCQTRCGCELYDQDYRVAGLESLEVGNGTIFLSLPHQHPNMREHY